jgi:glycosyltransferase involved in cell wall biosynthesis
MRYAWDLESRYLEASGLRGIRAAGVRSLMHYLRMWDTHTANGVDRFIANSGFIARRIRKTYGRDSTVVHPPVDVDAFQVRKDKDDYYITVSRLVPYKRIDLLVEAFALMPERRLIVIGDGPEMSRIKAKADKNVKIIGHQPFDVVRDLLAGARAFVFAAEEDFGIAPVEAQACGTPVIAYGRGGIRDTVVPWETGMFFDRQTPEAVIAAVEEFEAMDQFEPQRIRLNAERFRPERFRNEFSRVAATALAEFEGLEPAQSPARSLSVRTKAMERIAAG